MEEFFISFLSSFCDNDFELGIAFTLLILFLLFIFITSVVFFIDKIDDYRDLKSRVNKLEKEFKTLNRR